VTETPEQAKFNVHVLRTLLLRSLEHLQRVALREWTERNVDDQQPAPASKGIPVGQLEPATSNDALEEGPTASDPITDQLASALAAELGAVGQDVSVMEDTSLLPPSGDLETELKEALAVQLTRPEPVPPVPSFSEEPGEQPTPVEAGPASPLEAAHDSDAPTVEGEIRPEVAVPPTEAKQPQPNGRSGVRLRAGWLIVVIAVSGLFAAFLYRDELGALLASVIDLFSSR
jgi:hypothetical protein